MSEQQEKQENQKTLVAFVAGLLIGGLLVWVFGGTPETTKPTEEVTQTDEESTQKDDSEVEMSSNDTDTAPEVVVPVLTTGDGDVEVNNQSAGMTVTLESAVFPSDEGWIAVRSYPNGQLGSILGAARYSKEQGLVPEEISLLAPTIAGRDYAVVFFTEDGDRVFNLATDVQIEGAISTFSAE